MDSEKSDSKPIENHGASLSEKRVANGREGPRTVLVAAAVTAGAGGIGEGRLPGLDVGLPLLRRGSWRGSRGPACYFATKIASYRQTDGRLGRNMGRIVVWFLNKRAKLPDVLYLCRQTTLCTFREGGRCPATVFTLASCWRRGYGGKSNRYIKMAMAMILEWFAGCFLVGDVVWFGLAFARFKFCLVHQTSTFVRCSPWRNKFLG